MNEADDIARRLDKREGAKVVSFKEVGLPIFRLNSLLTLQEESPIGTIEEFVLRCVQKGIDTTSDLEIFLGLPRRVLSQQLGQLLHEGAIGFIESSPVRYTLTGAGKRRIEDSSLIRIAKEQVPIYVDGITRRVVTVEPRDLWSNSQLETLGVAAVHPTPRRTPRADDVDLIDVNRMFATLASDRAVKRRAIRLDAIVGRVNVVFRRAVAIAFKSDDGRRMSIGFALEGRESEEHEVAYARAPDTPRSLLFGTLFDANKRRREVQAVARELRADAPVIFPPTIGRQTLTLRKTELEPTRASKPHVRMLSVYDHPPLLRQAFDEARTRLLLISPWIRATVVNQEFVQRLIRALEREVSVTIAYGIGRRDTRERPADVAARESLAALAASFKNFRFVRKGDTHAKVLVVDSAFFVTTSFNWLSFSGDPSQPMREEEGTIVEDASAVEEYYQKLLARIVGSAGQT